MLESPPLLEFLTLLEFLALVEGSNKLSELPHQIYEEKNG